VIEDEKHAGECGKKAYAPILYAPKEALFGWVAYVDSVSEATLRDSLERFKAISQGLTHMPGATVDELNVSSTKSSITAASSPDLTGWTAVTLAS
jgi:hypothetical protein